jgi:HTH-type transcriptional regulator / antitoxin MqsA
MEEQETCYLCQGPALFTRERREVSAGSRRVMIDDEFYRCSNCGEMFYSGGMADESFRRGAAAVREQEGLLQPDEIRAIRSSYGLTQAGLETLIGAGEKTVTRWEHGTVAQNATADTLLRVLRDHPEVAARLAAERGVKMRLPETEPAASTSGDQATTSDLSREDVRHAA